MTAPFGIIAPIMVRSSVESRNFPVSEALELVLQFKPALHEYLPQQLLQSVTRFRQGFAVQLFYFLVPENLSQAEDLLAEQFRTDFVFFDRAVG